jgi:serine protease Do
VNALVTGQRIDVADTTAMRFTLSGDVSKVAVAGVAPNGRLVRFEQAAPGEWTTSESVFGDGAVQVVAYLKDDRAGGAVNDHYPATLTLDGQTRELPQSVRRLAVVILAETYSKDGRPRIKIGGDGFTQGLESYARPRGIDPKAFPDRSTAPPPIVMPPRREHGRSPSGHHPISSGSGILVAPGIIVTNAHVVENGSSFQAGSRRVQLELLATDQIHDLAVLRGDVEGDCLPLRTDGSAWLGEAVIAAGYPLMDLLGSDLKVSMGNVSGLTGPLGDVSRFLFTAPIGSGSSGGAVVDEHGNVLGVTSASLAHGNLRDHGAVSENVNFAVKASLVREMLASVGIDLPDAPAHSERSRKDVVSRLRRGVVSIGVGR